MTERQPQLSSAPRLSTPSVSARPTHCDYDPHNRDALTIKHDSPHAMISLSSLSILLAAALVLSEPAHSATVAEHPSQREATRQLYTQAHSLGHTYKFPARDGWTALNITDMQYKYRRSLSPDSEDDNTYGVPDAGAEDVYSLGKRTSRKDKDGKKKAKKAKSKSKKAAVKTAGALAVAGGIGGLGGVVGGTIDNVDNALEGFGNPEPVVITW